MIKLPLTMVVRRRLGLRLLSLASTMILGSQGVTKAHIASLESVTHYFLKGYGRAPGAESISDPLENKVVVFEDFFAAGLHMPPHPVLLDILCKFWVQLHQLTPNAIVQISKFI
jgi:hypothetical protein